jgi:hypothetical protein
MRGSAVARESMLEAACVGTVGEGRGVGPGGGVWRGAEWYFRVREDRELCCGVLRPGSGVVVCQVRGGARW